MADTDTSSPIVRYNLVLNKLEYFNGSDWYSAVSGLSSGITQLTDYVTAGPGSGSQAATVLKVQGVTDGSDATPGDVGEIIISSVAGPVGTNITTTDTVQTLTSIDLTPGDWDVTGSIAFTTGTSDVSAVLGNIRNDTSLGTFGIDQFQFLAPTSSADNSMTFSIRASLTTPTTYNLNGFATFTMGNPSFYGTLKAYRVR